MLCPITEIWFSGDEVKFSKETDNLPIFETSIAFKMCMNPTERQGDPSVSFYPTEVDADDFCKVDELTKEKFDDRYERSGL